ncbi:MAG: DUF3298 and DUF4163 domain-containing protein [Lachnospiraceae bacterium]|nr:DUF3298 and DUF4163 domain-containing protein [Lachnospiraceae bacterium]
MKKMSVKKLITLSAMLALSMAFTACGKKESEEGLNKSPEAVEEVKEEKGEEVKEEKTEEVKEEENTAGEKEEAKEGSLVDIIRHKVSCTPVEDVTLKGFYDTIEAEASYGEKYPELAAKLGEINEELKKEALDGIAACGGSYQDFETAVEDPAERESLLEAYKDMTYESEISLKRADDIMFSFTVSSYSFTGGAHPFQASVSYNLDPKSGKEISLEDVVGDYENIHELIKGEVLKEYADYELDEDTLDDSLAMIIKDKTFNFIVNDEGLYIIFNPYDIAPYAAGDLSITLSYEDYPDLLKEEYVLKEKEDLESMVTKSTDEATEEVEPSSY